jgi:hypothetical protein
MALVLATPVLVGATRDATGDVTTCVGGGPVRDRAADVISVDGLAAELGTSAVWRITFAAPIHVPDTEGAPVRIDVLVRDPELPARSLGTEHGMNRIVRWDDTGVDRPIDIVWLGGQGHTPFNPPVISGRSVEIHVPGRILLGEAQNGTESVRRARWSVLVRDGDACDRVGGVPRFRLQEATSTTSPVPTGGSTTDSVGPSRTSSVGPIVLAAGIVIVAALSVTAIMRRRSF